jgi:catechol 2,3-dioxygenase-like lactoylglutathione lyase family enzyme
VSYVSCVVESLVESLVAWGELSVAPHVRRILETVLYCADLTQTADFYRKLLDVPPMLTGDRLVAFDAGQTTLLLLFQRGNSGALEMAGGLVPGHDGSGPVHIAFAIDAAQLNAWESHLSHLGIDIESRVRWDGGGTSLYFRDPDGRSVELATPGMWPSY